MKLMRVNMEKLEVRWEPVPPVFEQLGGRALIAKLLLEEILPACEALGPHNKLVFTPGLLAGGGVTTAGRLSVGGKSPLTGGVKEANGGGTAGDTLAKLGIKAIVVEDRAPRGDWYVLHVTGDSASLLPAGDLMGLGTYATSDRLQERYGADSTVISIGQAGEYLMYGASIAITGDRDQRSNHAARGGLGAVMGSKGLKAIVIDKPLGKSIPLADADLFRTAMRTLGTSVCTLSSISAAGNPKLRISAALSTRIPVPVVMLSESITRTRFSAPSCRTASVAFL